LSTDILETLARARGEGAAACVLAPRVVTHPALLALTTDDVPLFHPRPLSGAWLRTRLGAADMAARVAGRCESVSRGVWRELYRELRRHAGDERLPQRLRRRLREMGQVAIARAAQVPVGEHGPFPRRLLRKPFAMRLPADWVDRARDAAARAGVPRHARLVAFDVSCRREMIADAIDFLVEQGYAIVHTGASVETRRRPRGVVDVSSSPDAALIALFVLLTCEFLVCTGVEAQHVAYLTNTATLTINSTDAFSAYPIRAGGLYALKTAIDLDSGRMLGPRDMLGEPYYRNLRNHGFRDNTAFEVLDAVREMHESRHGRSSESDAQAAFRARVVEAGAALAPSVRHVAAWGPDEGFIGDGRLIRVQADRAL
jgi:putative glycosyltransferase (TIGR04372 family)